MVVLAIILRMKYKCLVEDDNEMQNRNYKWNEL